MIHLVKRELGISIVFQLGEVLNLVQGVGHESIVPFGKSLEH